MFLYWNNIRQLMFYKTGANIFLIRFYRITIHTQWRFTYQKGVDMHDGRGSRMQKRRALSRKKYSSDVMALLVVLLSTSTIYGVVVVSIKTGFTLGHFQKIVEKKFLQTFFLCIISNFRCTFSPTLAILRHYINQNYKIFD